MRHSFHLLANVLQRGASFKTIMKGSFPIPTGWGCRLSHSKALMGATFDVLKRVLEALANVKTAEEASRVLPCDDNVHAVIAFLEADTEMTMTEALARLATLAETKDDVSPVSPPLSTTLAGSRADYGVIRKLSMAPGTLRGAAPGATAAHRR